MDSKMNSVKSKGPIIDPGVCRCCGTLKKCRLLNVEYSWLGHKEIYSEMFVDCFGLVLSQLDGEPIERLICATCVTRLRDASLFRQQVLLCEEKLLSSYIKLHDDEKAVETNLRNGLKDEKPDIRDYVAATSDNEYDAADSIEIESPHEQSHMIKQDKSLLFLNVNSGNKLNNVNNDVSGYEVQEIGQKKIPKQLRRRRIEKCNRFKQKNFKVARKNKTKPPDKQNIKKSDSRNDKSYRNAITIVENSYVCPFNAFFNYYYCIYCRQKFIDPEKLRAHTLSHDPLTYKEALNNIIRRRNKKCHIDLHRIDCRLCDQKIDNLETFETHISKVHGKKVYPSSSIEEKVILKFCLTNDNLKCMECQKTFTNFHSLKLHMAEHFGTCVCDVCGAHYFEKRMLLAHLKSHRPSDVVFPCNQCSKTFKVKYNLTIHIARLHTKEPAYLCSKCDETFFSDTLRRKHMIGIHNEESIFKCKNCDKVYDNKRTLSDHNRRIHLKILKHECNICEKRFFLPCKLKEHMSIHTGERNYRCEHCGKSYPRLSALKVHMQSHSSEKKYKCGMCDASYSQNVCLKNHIKRQHQNIDMDDSF